MMSVRILYTYKQQRLIDMESVQISLENLIKTNNGFFKSDAQAEFLLSKLKEEFGNTFITSVYNNSVIITYEYDEKGIVRKTNTSIKKQTTKVVWERKIEGKRSIEEERKLKQIKKEISRLKTSISCRLKAKQNGSYDEMEELFNEYQTADENRLKEFEQMLKDLS